MMLLRVLRPLVPAVLCCALFAGVGIAHVGSRVLVVNVGYRLSSLEQDNRTLTRENDRLRLELATLKNPNRLERLAQEQGMHPPAAGTVLNAAPVRVALEGRRAGGAR
jgi:cell division protein FtsL